jgi:hypothetical protein
VSYENAPTAPYQPFVPPTAPAGTRTGTVWIWLIVLLPLLSLPALFLIDIAGYTRTVMQNPASPTASLALFASPGFIITMVLGWVSTIASILFCYLDWRTLKARGVPAPFHWAFGFLVLASAGIVYPIGRSVVVKRRTGTGYAPMIVAIIVFVVIILVSIVWTAVVTSQILSMVPSYVYS